MKIFSVFVFFALFSSTALAQHSEQPQRESHTDLRNQSVLFTVDIVEDKTSYHLERTIGRDYFLRRITSNKQELKKLASHYAQQLDREFSSLFLKVQYEIPEVDGKCDIVLRLILRGESQNICKKDDKKTQAIKKIRSDFANLF